MRFEETSESKGYDNLRPNLIALRSQRFQFMCCCTSFVRGVSVNVRDGHGNTVLIVACQNGHKRALKAALRRGANLDAINNRGNTALHFCYAFGTSRHVYVRIVRGLPLALGNCASRTYSITSSFRFPPRGILHTYAIFRRT